MPDISIQLERVAKPKTIQVDAESHALFQKSCRAMPQSPPIGRVAAALIRWFSRRGDIVKSAVMSGIDEGMELAYARALRETADEIERRAIKRVGEFTEKEPAGKRLARPVEVLRK